VQPGWSTAARGRTAAPRRTPQPIVRTDVHVRLMQRLGPLQIADRFGLAPPTVHQVLRRCRLNRLSLGREG